MTRTTMTLRTSQNKKNQIEKYFFYFCSHFLSSQTTQKTRTRTSMARTKNCCRRKAQPQYIKGMEEFKKVLLQTEHGKMEPKRFKGYLQAQWNKLDKKTKLSYCELAKTEGDSPQPKLACAGKGEEVLVVEIESFQ